MEVQHENGQLAPVLGPTGHRVLQPVRHQAAVGEAREGIVERLVGELGLEGLAVVDVAQRQDDSTDARVFGEALRQHVHRDGGAVAALRLQLGFVADGEAAKRLGRSAERPGRAVQREQDRPQAQQDQTSHERIIATDPEAL